MIDPCCKQQKYSPNLKKINKLQLHLNLKHISLYFGLFHGRNAVCIISKNNFYIYQTAQFIIKF